MDVVIKTIPHAEQRYETCGDWWWEGDTLQMRVSSVGDWKKEMCLAYHEMLEALECKATGVTQKQVDDFDMNWQPWGDYEEPGDDPTAPYYWAHQHAMVSERHLANCLGLSWVEYEKAVEEL